MRAEGATHGAQGDASEAPLGDEPARDLLLTREGQTDERDEHAA
jgi:hypothetical protein